MDNLTHTLTGFALARAGLGRTTPGATLALVLGSNLPDADVVTWLNGTATYLQHHRDITHSMVGAPTAALVLAVVLRLVARGSRFASLLRCALVAVAGHVFMDLWTSYGTRALAPFDRAWHAWDLVFIVDPYILAALGACLLVSRTGSWAPRAATLGLGIVLAYVGARAVLHAQALETGLARVSAPSVIRAAALPTPLDPFRWRLLVDAGSDYHVGDVHLLRSAPPPARRRKRPEDAIVAHVRERSEVAAVFLDFSRFPWLEVEPTAEGTVVRWTDLRFERPGEQRFMTRVLVAPDGRIRSEHFRF